MTARSTPPLTSKDPIDSQRVHLSACSLESKVSMGAALVPMQTRSESDHRLAVALLTKTRSARIVN